MPELESSGEADGVSAGGPALGAAWLAGLEARRQDEPEAVAAELATTSRSVRSDLYAA